MELNEMEKKQLFQVEGDCQAKVLNELYMTVRYSNNGVKQVVRPKVRIGVSVPGNPFMGIRS